MTINSFLSGRKQRVKIDIYELDILCSNTGAPQGCILSPFLFSVYTNEVQSRHPNIKVFKYADDMAIVGLLNHTKPDDFYFQTINFILNTYKTKEMIIHFGRTFSVELPVFIDSKVIKIVCSFKHLVT